NNLGISLEQLPLIYVITGICSILTGPMVGRLSDKLGKFRIFLMGAILTIIMVVIYTNLGVTPLGIVILVNVFLYVGVFARIIAASALMSAIPKPTDRGSYMS